MFVFVNVERRGWGRMDETRGGGLRDSEMVGAEFLTADADLVVGVGRFEVCLADAAVLEVSCFGLGFAVVTRGVLVLTGDSKLFDIALGNSSDTCSIASSRASIASTESSIRAIRSEGDRLTISSTKDSGPSPVCSLDVTIRAGVLVLIDPTNESPRPRSAARPVDDVEAWIAGSNLGVLTAATSDLVDFLSGLLFRGLPDAVAATLRGVFGLALSVGSWKVCGTVASSLVPVSATSTAGLPPLRLLSSEISLSVLGVEFSLSASM